MSKKNYEERNLKFETLQLHVGQEQPDPVTDVLYDNIQTAFFGRYFFRLPK